MGWYKLYLVFVFFLGLMALFVYIFVKILEIKMKKLRINREKELYKINKLTPKEINEIENETNDKYKTIVENIHKKENRYNMIKAYTFVILFIFLLILLTYDIFSERELYRYTFITYIYFTIPIILFMLLPGTIVYFARNKNEINSW
ncbi:MAG: hypothetical protein LBH73_01500 [Spirochaetaceae bacterium]|jgi:uncharacterized membrane protein|nr:hypothetical protein [Spirochaetaceae bacterium]